MPGTVLAMGLRTWTVALQLFVASGLVNLTTAAIAPTAARADEAADRRAAANAACDELSSSDDAVRAKAAARLAELGRIGAAAVVRRGADLDDRAWTACADAFIRAKCSWCAYPFVAAVRKAPAAHAKRLLELAHVLDPLAGAERTPQETAAEVDRLLDESGRSRCATGYDERIALLGHSAIEPLLAGMRDGDAKHPGGSVACSAVALLAEEEDLPAIRELVLAGKTNLVRAIERMQREGVREATDALLDAVGAGRLDTEVTRALGDGPDKARVLNVVNAWIASQSAVPDGARGNLAWLFEKLDARESVATLESWIATSKEPETFVSLAGALVRFGSPHGVRLLVRIASERPTRFPCRPSTPEEQAAAAAPDRLCPTGFAQGDRARAAQELTEIAGKDVFDVPEDWYRRPAAQRREDESDDEYLDRAAASFRAWWEGAKDKLRFDAETGRWRVGA